MVEWIEIAMTYYVAVLEAVSTLVVEWIEIIPGWEEHQNVEGLHPRGGVD